MKILVLVEHINDSAPGLVFSKFINELSSKNELEIISAGKIQEENFPRALYFYKSFCPKLSSRKELLLQRLFLTNPIDALWAFANNKKYSESYDVILSLVSGVYLCPLFLGYKLAKKYDAKYVVYSTDAIPAPGWDVNVYGKKARKKIVARYLKYADCYCTINEKMLKYQLTTFCNKPKLVPATIPLSVNSSIIENYSSSTEIVFLYTGGIYLNRKATHVLKAFEKLLVEIPNARFVFVGTKIPNDQLLSVHNETLSHIEFYGYSKDLTPFYKRCSVLVDIDSDVPNDVFLSSKIISYLTINRPILCQTGAESPSRALFNGFRSIIQCDHDVDELVIGMKKSIRYMQNVADYTDRENLIKELTITNIVNKFTNTLNSVLEK